MNKKYKTNLEISDQLKNVIARNKSLEDIAKNLNLPYFTLMSNVHSGPCISIQDLWDILNDEVKLKELLSRARNKAFW